MCCKTSFPLPGEPAVRAATFEHMPLFILLLPFLTDKIDKPDWHLYGFHIHSNNMNEKMASYKTAGTLVHYRYRYHDSRRWWESQPHPPPCAPGCTLQHLASPNGCTSDQLSCQPWSLCSIVLPASTQGTRAEQVDDVLQTSAWVQAQTRFSPLAQATGGWAEFSQSHSCRSAVGPATPTQNGTMAKQEEKLCYQTSKCQICFLASIQGLCFISTHTHPTASCIRMQTSWNSSREVGERPLKISFLFQTVFPGHLLSYVILLSLQLYSWKGKY